jgi:hypothetical protein
MRVMILAKTSPEHEGRAPEGGQGMAEMDRFHDELSKAGVLLASGALSPSAEGAKVRFGETGLAVTDGPFTEAKELVAGYWLWQVRSMDEAIEWLKKAPFPQGVELEVRPVAMFQDPGA